MIPVRIRPWSQWYDNFGSMGILHIKGILCSVAKLLLEFSILLAEAEEDKLLIFSIIPKIGKLSFLYKSIDRTTSIWVIFWGVVTIITPSK